MILHGFQIRYIKVPLYYLHNYIYIQAAIYTVGVYTVIIVVPLSI